MSKARIALLPDRGVVSVTGEDARKLLQGVITNDMDLLDTQPAMYAGLLSPQGKVLLDFLVIAGPSGYLLDVARDKVEDLVKRLTMYRLRARAQLADRSASYTVGAGVGSPWPDDAAVVGMDGSGGTPVWCAARFTDPRSEQLGERIVLHADAHATLARLGIATSPVADYHARRIALGIPEGGKDWDFGDAFPHEAGFDLIDGVSFDKGCYVGQEIVARMQHRGTVRKRVARVTAPADLPATRPDVTVGDVVIGRLGSVAGRRGLALLRLDRAIEAIEKGLAVTCGGLVIDVDPEMIARQRELMAQKAHGP